MALAAKRYTVVSDTLPVSEVVQLCLAVGERVAPAWHSGIVFVDLTDHQAASLAQTLHISSVREVRPYEVGLPLEPESAPQGLTVESLAVATQFAQVRDHFSPPLTGVGARVALIDSGLSPHETIGDAVIYEKDYSGAGNTLDEFNHGTGVASMLLGIAPGVKLLNCRVLDATGKCSVEPVVLAIEDMIDLVMTDDTRYPTILNLSIGTPDTGDPHDPLKMACEAAVNLGRPEALPGPHQLIIIAAAGNDGPAPGTVISPASDSLVVAVGAIQTSDATVCDWSSRGPTKDWRVKPDGVFYGQDITLASADSPSAYKVRTGTSFAAPAIAGVIALAVEMGWRMMGNPTPVPGGQATITPQPSMTVSDLFDLASRVGVKPQGAPSGKDNAYGYGLPFGTLVEQALAPLAGATLDSMITPIATLAVLGMIVPNIMRMFKAEAKP